MMKRHLLKIALLVILLTVTGCGKSTEKSEERETEISTEKPADISADQVEEDFVNYMKNDELQDVEIDSMSIETDTADSGFITKNINVNFTTNSVNYERQYALSYEKDNGSWTLVFVNSVDESSWTRNFQDEISAETMAKLLKDAHIESTDSAGSLIRVKIVTINAEDIEINTQELDLGSEVGAVNASFTFQDDAGQEYEVSNANIGLDCGEIHDGSEYWKLCLSTITVDSSSFKIK